MVWDISILVMLKLRLSEQETRMFRPEQLANYKHTFLNQNIEQNMASLKAGLCPVSLHVLFKAKPSELILLFTFISRQNWLTFNCSYTQFTF